jgi:hypothetical protein
MRGVQSLCLAILPLLISGCEKNAKKSASRDACSLVSKEEVGSVQEGLVKETNSSERSDGVFRFCQCFYTATEFSKSVNLVLVEKDLNQRSKRSPKDFWNEKFGPYNTNERERDGKAQSKAGDEKEKGTPPKKVSGLGDDAYWVSNRFGGVLYILKGDVFLSIGLGGTDDEDTKLNKSKVLAQKALQRL